MDPETLEHQYAFAVVTAGKYPDMTNLVGSYLGFDMARVSVDDMESLLTLHIKNGYKATNAVPLEARKTSHELPENDSLPTSPRIQDESRNSNPTNSLRFSSFYLNLLVRLFMYKSIVYTPIAAARCFNVCPLIARPSRSNISLSKCSSNFASMYHPRVNPRYLIPV